MDRGLLFKLLDQAEQRVSQGDAHVREQRRRIRGLQHKGLDTAESVALLALFEDMLAMHVADRDRLKELTRVAA